MRFSKILVKLIDQAIAPALILLCVRFAFLIAISRYYGISLSLSNSGFTFENETDFRFVNTYSTFAMVAVLAIALFYILVKAYVFHDSHIKPSLTAKLFTLNLASFIENSFEVYSQGLVWLLFSYLLTIISGLMLAYNAIESWVFITSGLLTLIATVLLVADVENEIEINKGTN